MAEYTTEEMRRRNSTGAPGSALSRSSSARAEADAKFDRWLEAVRREAKAEAWAEAAKFVRPNYRAMMLTGVDNSHVVAVNECLHRAADRLEKHAATLHTRNPEGTTP